LTASRAGLLKRRSGATPRAPPLPPPAPPRALPPTARTSSTASPCPNSTPHCVATQNVAAASLARIACHRCCRVQQPPSLNAWSLPPPAPASSDVGRGIEAGDAPSPLPVDAPSPVLVSPAQDPLRVGAGTARESARGDGDGGAGGRGMGEPGDWRRRLIGGGGEEVGDVI
jgi:hypothetical protein